MGATSARRLALALALGVALLALPAPASAAPLRCNGEARLCDRPFDRVVLPATHNSMSARALGWQIPNQILAVPDQLRRGIRGLLIDTYYGHRAPDGRIVADPAPVPGGGVYVCHIDCRLGATPLVDVLRAVRLHLRADPANVLVIINQDGIRPGDYAREVRRSGLIRNVFRGRPGPRWPTLRRMIARRQQVVMLAEADSGDVPWYHEAYGGIVQETGYTWPRAGELIEPASLEASCRPNRGGTTGSLFLMNHWSPPVAPDPDVSVFVNAKSVLVKRARACRRVRGRLPTLVAVDLFGVGQLLEAVRRLNGLNG